MHIVVSSQDFHQELPYHKQSLAGTPSQCQKGANYSFIRSYHAARCEKSRAYRRSPGDLYSLAVR